MASSCPSPATNCATARPAGVIDDALRRDAAEHRGELLALLSGDADKELCHAVAVIDGALSLPWLSQEQRGVLAAMQAVVEMYDARRDPLLFGSSAWIEAHVERWRAAHEEIRSR